MKILLDTNFILSCIKQKIDFFSLANELFDEKLEWIVPCEVLGELKELGERVGEKTPDKEAANVGLEFVKLIKAQEVDLGDPVVDNGIVNYANKHAVVVATMDKELKKRLNSKIFTIRAKKGLEIV